MPSKDEVLLALYNRKVKRVGNTYALYDTVFNCNLNVSSQVAFFKAEDFIDDSLKLTKEGQKAVMEAMRKKL